MTTLISIGFVVLFCSAAGIKALREKRYLWAAAALMSTVIVLTLPIPTHAVKVYPPVQTS